MYLTHFSSKYRGLKNFYSMSYLYFGAMATSSVVIVGLIVSYVTGKKEKVLTLKIIHNYL